MTLRSRARELYELGFGGASFRVGWEALHKSGAFALFDRTTGLNASVERAIEEAHETWEERLPLADPHEVREGVKHERHTVEQLCAMAERAARGEILCYGHVTRDYGDPIDWHRDPVSRHHYDPSAHWSKALAQARGDIKDVWEVGRMPQLYHLARASVFAPETAERHARELTAQLHRFFDANPYGRGPHWSSGQEIAIRLLAIAFALRAFGVDAFSRETIQRIAKHFALAGHHIARYVSYARYAVHNNHLLGEALGLMLVGHLLPETRHYSYGKRLLDEGVRKQFYADGSYIQQSHNYHRVALQYLLWAAAILRKRDEELPHAWREALARSTHFLAAQQNVDGRLPNFGNNDGALPSPLSASDFSDFRPTLQATSLASHGEALYPPGPWDEEARWFGEAPQGPVRTATRTVSFKTSGYHVLAASQGNYGVFRCGTLRDRFAQIDMLHLDVFYRGVNVLADAGSYRYNGAPIWHRHFFGTQSHNTVSLDGADQMLHWRQFKTLYPTRARMLALIDEPSFTLVTGEHDGYRRLSARATHRRSVLFVKDDLWIVADTLYGVGEHDARLHWLAGVADFSATRTRCTLHTSAGPFSISLHDADGAPHELDILAGGETPPRGWLSRYYSVKKAVPSIVVRTTERLPITFLSVLGAGSPTLSKAGEHYQATGASTSARFSIERGHIRDVAVVLGPPLESPTDAR